MENESNGLQWDLSGPDPDTAPDAGAADLLYKGELIAIVNEYRDTSASPFFAVDTFASSNDRGDLQDRYSSLAAGMQATEDWAFDRGIQLHREWKDTQAALENQRATSPDNPMGFFQKPTVEALSEASESFYARLADLAESRGADMDRGNGFDMER